MRAAVIGGGAYYAGKKVQQGKAQDAETEARLEQVEAQQASAAPAPEPAAGGADMVQQLESLKKLLDEGVLTQEEFDLQKQKILAGS